MSIPKAHAHPYGDLQPPSDARDPFAWMAGSALRAQHRFNVALGQCVSCASIENPCPYALLGWEISRQALEHPESLPYDPPG